jgi:PIN domain nuclease of toxin-antitoxin system
VLAVAQEEPGSERTQRAADDGAAIGAVNLAEVVSRLVENGMDEAQVRQRIALLALEVVSFDEELAYQTGLLRPLTRHLGLSLGDRACLALAIRLGLPALTADRSWATLALGAAIEIVR